MLISGGSGIFGRLYSRCLAVATSQDPLFWLSAVTILITDNTNQVRSRK
jgi:hypothetical protein